jgi:protein-disulfide isomerase
MSKKSADRSRSARAQAALAAQERAERRRQLLVVGGVVVALVLIVVVGYLVTSGRDSTGETPEAVPNGVTDSYAVVVGDESAPTTITLFADLQCPVCKAFEDATADQVDQAVAAGKVKVEYRPISILDRASTTDYSSRALNALMVVLDTTGADAFVDYQRLLFENQPAEGTAGLSDDELIEYAVQAGADEGEIREPIEDKVFEQWIRNATDQASTEGVNGTPTVLIDGKSAGENPQESAQAVLAAVA